METARKTLMVSTAVLGIALAAACGNDAPTSPSPVAVVTFAVGSEEFRVALTSLEQLAAARAAQHGGPVRIPVGRIAPGRHVNTGWTWHLEDLSFAEVTIELCDGRPSDVERAGTQFGGGRFCPWTATVVRIN